MPDLYLTLNVLYAPVSPLNNFRLAKLCRLRDLLAKYGNGSNVVHTILPLGVK